MPPHDCLPPRWGRSSYRQERHSVRGRVRPTYSMPTASSQISLRFVADWYRQGPQSMGRPPVSPTPHVPVLSAGAVRKAPNLCSGRQCCHSKKSRVGCLKDRCVSHKKLHPYGAGQLPAPPFGTISSRSLLLIHKSFVHAFTAAPLHLASRFGHIPGRVVLIFPPFVHCGRLPSPSWGKRN